MKSKVSGQISRSLLGMQRSLVSISCVVRRTVKFVKLNYLSLVEWNRTELGSTELNRIGSHVSVNSI